MRVLLTGATGQVGTEFLGLADRTDELIAPGRGELDLADERSLRRYIQDARPDWIVNAGAYTAVDLAEKDRDLCFAVNATAPTAIAEEASRLNAGLIHFSTDYVFDGKKDDAYREDDATAPLSVYGASKAAGEQGILAAGGRALVLRTSWVYGLHGKNFLLTMLRLAKERPELRVVDDQMGAPTSALAIARATARLIGRLHGKARAEFPQGIYHMTAGGSTSWCGFAAAIVERAALDRPPRVTPISTAEYPTPAARPRNSRLSNEKFEATFGFRLPDWEAQLDQVFAERQNSRLPTPGR
jgi:dTDP-4-dehydrorhamnose reductase